MGEPISDIIPINSKLGEYISLINFLNCRLVNFTFYSFIKEPIEGFMSFLRSAISNFVDGLFIEVHPDPKNAKCDAATQFSFSEFENLMSNVKPLWDFVNSDKT